MELIEDILPGSVVFKDAILSFDLILINYRFTNNSQLMRGFENHGLMHWSWVNSRFLTH